ncbi:MAG: AraC family ligand binding domain-containing protein, partial [Bacteroidota bacterium]
MKPIPEKIIPNLGSSFYFHSYQGNDICTAPFWHIHPEYELVFIDKGKGQRHIGNHFSYYQDGDLLLIGPNLPHKSFIHLQDNFLIVYKIRITKRGVGE